MLIKPLYIIKIYVWYILYIEMLGFYRCACTHITQKKFYFKATLNVLSHLIFSHFVLTVRSVYTRCRSFRSPLYFNVDDWMQSVSGQPTTHGICVCLIKMFETRIVFVAVKVEIIFLNDSRWETNTFMKCCALPYFKARLLLITHIFCKIHYWKLPLSCSRISEFVTQFST